jgi:hypothetical protein
MSEIISNGDAQDGQIILGDETSQQAISFKLAQAFYSEITGKSEKISEKFTKSFILTIENIEQLHKRIIQSTTQYNVASANVSFAVEYQNDSSERFSSIDRFKTHAGSKGVPAEEVDINYNFLFILPGTQKPQEYRINIRLISRIVKLEDLREKTEDMPFSVPLWQFDNELTCRASIDFIDITVANAFMSVIRTWNNGLDEVETNNIIKKLRPYSRYMPAFFKYGLLFSGVYYTMRVVDGYFSSPSAHTTAMFILIAYLFNFMLWKIGLFTGRRAESHLNQLYEVSYILFSGADNNLAKQCKTAKRNNTIFSFAYLVGTFVVGVLASVVANFIFKS